jgi:beta-glucosidase
MALAACLPPLARGEPTASSSDERAVPAVARHAPFTPKVLSLLAVLSLDEKLSLVHGAADPTLLGNVGYVPGVPRLGIPPRRDADALGIQVAADATALPARLGLGATFDRTAAYAAGAARLGATLGPDRHAAGKRRR